MNPNRTFVEPYLEPIRGTHPDHPIAADTILIKPWWNPRQTLVKPFSIPYHNPDGIFMESSSNPDRPGPPHKPFTKLMKI